MLDCVGALFYVLSARLGQKLNLLQCSKTFTFHIDQGRLLLVWICVPLTYFGSWVRYPVWQHTFVSPSAFSRRAVVSYWRKYVHEILVNRLGGLSLPRKNVVRLTDRPHMTLDVYRGRKTTIQQQQQLTLGTCMFIC